MRIWRKKWGLILIDLNDAGEKPGGRELVKNVDLKHGLKKKSYWISKCLFDADCVISVPVLKNHRNAGVTLSLKNYIGIAPADIYQVPGVTASKFGLNHSTLGLAQHIVDLVMIRPPDYAIIDALVGLASGIRTHGLQVQRDACEPYSQGGTRLQWIQWPVSQ